jgi:hypothetical protein
MQVPNTSLSWVRLNWFRLSILFLLILVTTSLVSFLSMRQELMKRSVELEQLRYEEEKLAASQRTDLEAHIKTEAREQEKREYIAKRRMDCFQIYEKERAKWSNVQGLEYDSEEDVCRIRYKKDTPTSKKACDKFEDSTVPIVRRFYYDCVTNTFTNEF